ncbi:Coenzyme F420 hydrogenase/dehydrogenase, beta subunit C-terminal domain [Schaedlerella arabinosiphila]|uniref:Coenzyme F420 hydrogenase/dehydrogenase, beta subunit C-terminal domain n=1 Tax=Schaedlerella arabinosiphila TaxID=2044587 RepID=UPI0025582E86|nr:Coenzyme F420 hydrogenase/dehydrogenase, beta subunit C-terminal domain [Schaedlerella arabinosiphila]
MDKECIGCGLCETMCHKQAITIGENRNGSFCTIDKELCDNCSVCKKICPIENIKIQENLSDVQHVAVGRSRDENVVKVSASGGIVSELLIYLFNTEQIDAAIVAHFDEYANIYGDIIESANDVLRHSGSYYHTSKQLINVNKVRKYKKVAVVGLPCHIEGIINYCHLTRQEEKVIKIALFCTVGRTYEGFRKFFKKQTGFDVTNGKVKKYISRYSDKKLIHIEDDVGNVYECPDELYKFSMDFFYANKSCLNCRKLYGLSADICIGDAWHRVIEKNGIKEKMAIISANTTYGSQLLDILQKNLSLELVDNGPLELISSQKYGVGLKQLHNERIIRGLACIRMLRYFNENALMHRVNCRIRGELLNRLALDTEKRKQKLKAKWNAPEGL